MKRFARPDWTNAAAVGLVYAAVAFATIALTRFGGGVACLWIAGAVLTGALRVAPAERWPAILAACGVGSFLATGLVGVGWAAAAPLMAVNLGEALLAVWLLGRFGARSEALDSMRRLAAFMVSAGLVAPAVTAAPGALVVAMATGTPFATNWINWFAGHALGAITFVPVVTFAASGAARRWVAAAGPRKRGEAAALLALVVAVSLLVFGQSRLPLLFLPILPVMLATFRIGRLGAAASVTIVALVGGALTMRGIGPISLLRVDPATATQYFQFYLAATVLTALPVAAELRRRRALFEALSDSEARYKLLADNSLDIVLSLHADGAIRYASPSIAALGGLSPEEVIGRNAVELVLPEYRGAVTRAHLQALAEPDRVATVEYQAMTGAGALRWFETHTRSVRDEAGRVTGAVSAIRDITQRKAVESELSRAAATDPLTGLANRRVFDWTLDRLLGRGPARPACLAIFDLDHFKRVNDRWGHEAGDRVLCAFADIARGMLREGDLVARLGGEEFGVLLPGADLKAAAQVCERLRQAVAATAVPVDGGTVRVTVSAGLAPIAAGTPRADLLRAADEALYHAKADGRDRLQLAA